MPIGVDERGAVVDELDDFETPAVLLTPAHHCPFGMPLHAERRTAVVEWAQRTDGYVFDDDYDGEFRYDRQPSGPCRRCARTGWCTWDRRARACRRRCGWAGWCCRTT